MTVEQSCLLLLVATIGLLLFAEFTRRPDASRVAALLAIVTILAADYFFMQAMPFGTGWAFERPAPARLSSMEGHGNATGERRGGAYDGSSGARQSGDDSMNAPAGSGLHADLAGAGRSLAHWLKSWLENPDDAASPLASISRFKDCDDCPEMVRIPAGTRLIGAAAGDPLAEPGEMPQRQMRQWPGFAMARTEISNRQLAAAGVIRHGDGDCPIAAADRPDAPATCVTAREMEAYVAWLNARTGRRYRLPTAAEWEFAAQASGAEDRGADGMGGGVAEMVSECWPHDLAATQILAVDLSETQITRCSHRIVKDGADDDPARWKRPSARRAFDAAARSPRVGFRVMRPFELTARNGF